MSETLTASTRVQRLLIAAEPALADLYEVWLGGQYRVESVNQGAEVLHAAHSADALVLDVALRDEDETHRLQTVRDRWPTLPLAVISTAASAPSLDGVEYDVYLRKPVEMETFCWVVEFLFAVRDQPSRTRRMVRHACEALALSHCSPAALTLDEMMRLETIRQELREDKAAHGQVEFHGLSPLPQKLATWLE